VDTDKKEKRVKMNRQQRRQLEKRESAKINEMNRMCLENGIQFLHNTETGENHFQHKKTKKRVLIETHQVDDDRKTLVTFIRELRNNEDIK